MAGGMPPRGSGGRPPGLASSAHAVIRPERVRIEEHGSPGENRVPARVAGEAVVPADEPLVAS